MRLALKVIAGVTLAWWAVVGAILLWLGLSPPELLRVGTGYTAKLVCSNVFIAGRNAGDVLAFDVQAPGNALLRLVGVSVDTASRSVTARMAGFIAPQTAIARNGLGCAVVPKGQERAARALSLAETEPLPPLPDAPWPQGDAEAQTIAPLAGILSNPDLLGPGMRAVIVIRDGRIIGEAYGAGFSRPLPLIGWSMAKTVNAALIGRLVEQGRIGLDDRDLLPAWTNDSRRDISLSSLLAMESGLAFNEEYGNVSDATRMLFLEPDMADFAATRPKIAEPGQSFSYSSGTGVLLSRIWMNRVGDAQAALDFPRQALFGPLSMRSAVLEADAAGTFVGSSYLYATARDWARFGLLLADDGVWNGTRLLPEGFVEAMATPTEASKGAYTRLQAWKEGPGGVPNAASGVPDDTFWLIGHDGQSMAVIRSQSLVVLRMGLTPSSLGYRPEPLVKAVARAVNRGG
ncbi:serine hydrolase domain-containing protein [Rhizobium halophytocola]|uniref:CubicO group peptidase (Beta-lactamase class C family) n=1 Tax=Rhizobium halophytocola TaxID=735519 RepID=A0ABS4E348_9HYPH|nr:serine hydrolase [Rhizobium halophytocola]MBP1852353.1 CubicO group peptidase (beta-lactamase class C family) [Rhizobium halophytocola]